MKKWLLVILLLSVLAWGQSSNVPDQNSAFWGASLNGVTGNASGTAVNYSDTRGTITNQFEIVAQGTAAATLTTTIVGCMRGGTCSSTLASSSGVSSQIIAAASSSLNVYDFYKVTLSWTGGDATTRFIVNRTGTVARLPGASGSGTVSANSGTVGAFALYAAAGGSTTVSPDANVSDPSGTFTVAEAMNQGTTGQTAWAAGGGLSKYKGTSTGGNGLAFVLGTPSNVTNQTASQTSVNLVASTPSGGQYEIQGYIDERTACSTVSGSQVIATFNWTDASLARSTSVTLTFDTSSVAASQKSFNIPLFANNATAITYTTTYTACATGGPAAYDLHASVIQLQ